MDDKTFEENIKSYKLYELHEALLGIDKEKYPDRTKMLEEAIAKYKDEGNPEEAENPSLNRYYERKLFAKSNISNVILTISTAGFYQVVWIYKSWKRCREIENSKISPFLRTLFCSLTSYYLFLRIKKTADLNNTNISVSPHAFALLVFASRMNISGNSKISEWIAGICFIIGITASIIMNNDTLRINKRITSSEEEFEKITTFEKIIVAIGIVLWIWFIHTVIYDN